MQPLRPALAPLSGRRPALSAALITTVFTLALCALVLVRLEQGPLAFASIGTRFSERDPNGTTGYDGQFVYFIARDGAAAVPLIDGPALRYMRIGLPVLARVFSFGSAELLPWVLIGLNVAAQAFGAGCTAWCARRLGAQRGVSTVAGVVYGLWIGGQFGVRYTLTEPLSCAFALAAIAVYLSAAARGFPRLPMLGVTALLIASTLTKETGLVFAAALALHAFAQPRGRGWGPLLAGGPLLAFAVWWLILYGWFGLLPSIYPAARSLRFVPLNGLFSPIPPVEQVLLVLWLAVPAVLTGAWAGTRALRLWARTSGESTARRLSAALSPGVVLGLAGAAWVFYMPSLSWQDQIAAYRIGTPLLVGALLLSAEAAPRSLRWWAALWLPGLLLVLITPLWHGGL
jgi:hypothetical protein